MPDSPQSLLQDGGVGVSAAYVVLTVPTSWLGVLPAIPDGLTVPLTTAFGTVLGCAFRGTRLARAARKAKQSTDSEG